VRLACFWELIERTKKNSSSTAEQMELLIAELEAFKAMEIKKFYKMLHGKLEDLYHWDVWAVAYLAQRGCSDDAFEYFRGWVVLQGAEPFALALSNIDSFSAHVPAGLRTSVEGLLSIREMAYEGRSGKALISAKGCCRKSRASPGKNRKCSAGIPRYMRVIAFSRLRKKGRFGLRYFFLESAGCHNSILLPSGS
jgi:hypothetical protein